MRLKAHCFAQNAEIKPSVFKIVYQGWDVSVMTCFQKGNNNLILEVSRKLTEGEIAEFKTEIVDDAHPMSSFSKRSRPFQEILTEVAHLFEGLISIFFYSVPPKFNTEKPIVNLIGENDEETKLLQSDSITSGFGYLADFNQVPKYAIEESIKEVIDEARHHLPAFSFFSQAIRSLKNNDAEVAFFLFFRIMDGYFSEGVSDVRKGLLKKAKEIEKFLPYSEELKKSTQSILKEMKIPSKSQEGYNGLIEDIVNIRHKLTHFSTKKASFHHSPKIKFDLQELNIALYKFCFSILRDKVINPSNENSIEKNKKEAAQKNSR